MTIILVVRPMATSDTMVDCGACASACVGARSYVLVTIGDCFVSSCLCRSSYDCDVIVSNRYCTSLKKQTIYCPFSVLTKRYLF